MACSNCENENDDCGCSQEGLHISQICNPIECETDECSESFKAGCIIYTDTTPITCNSTELVTSGDTVAQALANMAAYFCAVSTYGLFAQTANSVTVSDPAGGTLIGAGQGTLAVAANTFNVGDSFRAKLAGHITCSNTQGLTINIKTNGNTIASTGEIDLKTATDKHWNLEVDFTIRTLGATGSLISAGMWTYIADAGGQSFEGEDFSDVNTIDTTVLNTLEVEAVFTSNEAGANTMYSELFTLTKTY